MKEENIKQVKKMYGGNTERQLNFVFYWSLGMLSYYISAPLQLNLPSRSCNLTDIHYPIKSYEERRGERTMMGYQGIRYYS